ncbi:MAG: hypothetical protein ACRD19_09175 [Terriglobia bacterium]
MTGKHFLLGFLCIAGLSAIVGALWSGDRTADVVAEEHIAFSSSTTPKPQAQRHRRMRHVHYTRKAAISSKQVGTPGRIRAGLSGTILVLDMQSHRVKFFSPTGALIRVVPKDPWLEGIDFAVGNQCVAIAGPNSSAYCYSLSNEQVVSTLPAEALRIEAIGNSFICERPFGKHLFSVYSRDGVHIRDFGVLLANQAAHGLAVLGNLASDDQSKTLFVAGIYAGFLAAYQSSGRLKYIVSTIDPLPAPHLELTTDGIKRIPFDAPYSSLSLAAARNKVFILTEIPPRARLKRSIIDVYNESTGAYLYSEEAPERSTGIAVGNGVIYTQSNSGIKLWTPIP